MKSKRQPIWKKFRVMIVKFQNIENRPISDLGTYTLWASGVDKDILSNRDQKEGGLAMLISGKVDSKIRTVTRGEERYHLIIKGSIQEEDTTTLNLYAPSMLVCVPVASFLSGSLTLWTAALQLPLSVRFSCQEYGSGCRALLQDIFPTQGSACLSPVSCIGGRAPYH